MRYGRVVLTNSTVSNNSVAGDYARGGGIYGYNETSVILTDSTVSGNRTAGYNGGGGGIIGRGTLAMSDSTVSGNRTVGERAYGGGILGLQSVTMIDSTVSGNSTAGNSSSGGGIFSSDGPLTMTNSTITANSTAGGEARGGGIYGGRYGGTVTLANTTVTANSAAGDGGGIYSYKPVAAIANSIVAGNRTSGKGVDLAGGVTFSNGHNIFGSDVDGAILGDLQGIAPGLIFANLDPETGGGLPNASGIVPLRNSITNPALSGSDPLAALPADQIGTARPLPAGSLPDIGAAERNQALSTSPSANNDVLTSTDGANTIAGKAGADLVKGHAGNDTLRGEGGSDVLDGGAGNDLLDGGDGIDLARFGGSVAVTVDLVAGTAKRGSETDTLSSIQGAIGSSAGDSFKGDGGPNWFQGGGRDVATGGAARDLYDFDRVQDSLPGAANRDVIGDLAPQSDRIDLTGIDADTNRAGNQTFRWWTPRH